MPTFTKLSEAEIAQRRTRRVATVDLSDYLDFLKRLKPGDWGSVTLEADERQRAVKRRLTTASKQSGKAIRYKRSEDGQLVFEVVGGLPERST